MTRRSSTIKAFKLMLSGEDLDSIDAPDDAKSDIRKFMKYRTLPIYQIRERTWLDTDTAFELKRMWKSANHPRYSNGYKCGVGWAIRQFAIGTPRSTIKMRVTAETIRKAEIFIKMANSGADECRISEKIGLTHYSVKKLLESFKLRYADSLAEFEPKNTFKEANCDNDYCDCLGCR